MTAATRVHPGWCVADHADENSEDTRFHYEEARFVPAGEAQMNVSVFWNEKTGQFGVYVGNAEFDIEQLPALIDRIQSAQQLVTLAALDL